MWEGGWGTVCKAMTAAAAAVPVPNWRSFLRRKRISAAVPSLLPCLPYCTPPQSTRTSVGQGCLLPLSLGQNPKFQFCSLRAFCQQIVKLGIRNNSHVKVIVVTSHPRHSLLLLHLTIHHTVFFLSNANQLDARSIIALLRRGGGGVQ